MIGFVIVSHSARLAEGVCELAAQVAQGKVRLAAAGGTGDPAAPIGTDAFKVLQAIESVFDDDGVLVFTDLGSAVLSAETAIELLDESRRPLVRLCDAPLVEGTVAAVSQAAAGAGAEEILRDASREPAKEAVGAEEAIVAVPNRLGLHARPAARLIRLARSLAGPVLIENTTRPAGPVDVSGINGVLGLGARQGHRLRISGGRQAVAAVAAFIEGGCGDKDADQGAAAPAPVLAPVSGQLAGLPASAGIAIGPLVRLRPAAVPVAPRVADDPGKERERLLTAIDQGREETRALYRWAKAKAGENEAGIFDAQLLFLEDEELTGGALRLVLGERATAETAWQAAAGKLAGRLAALDDPYLRARAADVSDVAARVLRGLIGTRSALPALGQPSVLAAHDLTPSEVRELDPAVVLGICLETGSASAHSVILARAMRIPVVTGVGPSLCAMEDGTTVGLDGERGMVFVSPVPDELRALEDRRRSWLAARRATWDERHKPASTRDGRRLRVFANISSVAEAAEALEYGAEGVGVLRTEFLFLGRATAPGEEEQYAAYRAIADALGGRPLVIRTLDIGGDKSVPYVEIGPEANPFLGWRGIRVTLGRRDLLKTQLRAILRAGAGRKVEVLFPMVSSLRELREAKAILAEVAGGADVKAGVMIEVPAAVAIADQLAREASFFSIGTNDLVQYAMAADRTNERVAAIADPFQPAVLRMIGQAIQAGRQAGIGVTVCGELAADPLATALLIGLGLEEFSVSAPLIPALKQAIARSSAAEAEGIARSALALDSSESVRRLLGGAG